MPEAFLVLLSGGVLLACAVPEGRSVTPRWLRLGGIIALCMFGLSLFFCSRREGSFSREALAGYLSLGVMELLQLAFAQISFPSAARLAGSMAGVVSIPLGLALLGHPARVPAGAALVGCVGVATMCGIILMQMLLGHAYLTASRMTMAPFQRMNNVFVGLLLLRMFFALCATLMQERWPTELFWTRQGLLVATRWLAGLLMPCLFVYMTHDCIKRRATQSATGILYVSGTLIFVGELIALYLTQQTGLPF